MAKVIIEGVRKNYLSGQRVVTLLDEAGLRFLNIWIPKMEALIIALGLTGIVTPRPTMAHFMANVMKATGVQLEEVRIEALKGNVFYAEQVLEREGITLPEGKSLQFTFDKEQARATLMKEMEAVMNPLREKTPPTEEELEQAKQQYLAFLLGESV